MREIIDTLDITEIQKYIEEKENVKLILEKKILNFCKKEGHEPHYDTGTNNHMLWCRYSASSLLTNEFSGGEFEFLDKNDNVLETINKESHFKKTLIFSVDNKHKVNPHLNGDRLVNLYFWKSVNPIKLSNDVNEYISNIEKQK